MKHYIKDCKNLFPIYGKKERIYLRLFQKQIEEYCSSIPSFSYEDIVKPFGSPFFVVTTYYENLDEEQEYALLKKLNLSKQIRTFLIIVIFTLIFALGFKSYLFYLDYQESRNSLIHTVETSIEEE